MIPTWNRAHTIQRAIDSALQQSLPVLEILVCDDGSSDDTEAVVAGIAKRNPRARWIAGKRGGRPAIPRNRGIQESRGDWLAFLDSDDAWRPDKLAVQLEAARRSGSLAVCSNATRVLADGRAGDPLLSWRRPRLALWDLLATNWVVCSSCIVHRALISKTGGFPEAPELKAVEDYVLWLRVAAYTEFAYCPDALVDYRDDPPASIRSQQEISPDRQRALVLEATKCWMLNAELGGSERISALASVQFAQLRHAFTMLGHKLKRTVRG